MSLGRDFAVADFLPRLYVLKGRKEMSATRKFKTEVADLLHLIIHSLYSNKEIFLRELISNASDAIDKLHFLSLTDAKLLGDDPELRITVKADKDARTLTVSDNGIGMTLDEANVHLGTIAKSGTEDFFIKPIRMLSMRKPLRKPHPRLIRSKGSNGRIKII